MSASDGWISGVSGVSTTGVWALATVAGLAVLGLVVLGIICTRKNVEGKPPFKMKVSLKKVLTFEFESGQPIPSPPDAAVPDRYPLEVVDTDPPKDGA